MFQAYSLNQAVSADGIVPFNNVVIDKGCAENLSGVGTIELNKCGVYKVTVDGVAADSTTLQLLREGVALPPVTLQVKNSTATTLNNVNITVDKQQ